LVIISEARAKNQLLFVLLDWLVIFFIHAIMCIHKQDYTHKVHKMRTNIVIDDQLMNDALLATGLSTKKEAVKLYKQSNIKKFRGKLKWEGDLDEMRSAK